MAYYKNMKLFLSSVAISKQQAPHLIQLVGKKPKDIKLALIENAADVEDNSEKWMLPNRQVIQSHNFDVELIDLRQYYGKQAELEAKLVDKDVIWLGGGNTFYLRWLLKAVGADKIITKLARQGTVYGGGSAGAIVAGPTLKHFEAVDDVSDAPEVILGGLNFTDKVVVPHMDSPKFIAIIHKVNDKLKADGYKTVPLGDAQALVIDGNEERII
jgi:dipeptidase E